MNTQTHELKIRPEYFDAVESGKKPFDVRKLDRLFMVGDILHLREWSPVKGYSGRETRKIVTYIMTGGQWTIPEGTCILGIVAEPISPSTELIADAERIWPYYTDNGYTINSNPKAHVDEWRVLAIKLATLHAERETAALREALKDRNEKIAHLVRGRERISAELVDRESACGECITGDYKQDGYTQPNGRVNYKCDRCGHEVSFP
jgi:hypothetical protein